MSSQGNANLLSMTPLRGVVVVAIVAAFTVWSGTVQSIPVIVDVLASRNDVPPGVPPDAKFTRFANMFVDANGRVFFNGDGIITRPGTSTIRGFDGLFSVAPGTQTLTPLVTVDGIAGLPAPGGGSIQAIFDFAANDAQTVVFSAQMDATAPRPRDLFAVNSSGVISQAATGDFVIATDIFAVTATNDVIFTGVVNSPSGVFKGPIGGGDFRTIAEQGLVIADLSVPGLTGGTFVRPLRVKANAAGDLTFFSDVLFDDGTTFEDGVFQDRDGATQFIGYSGGPAPDLPDGTIWRPESISLAPSGDIVVHAEFDTPTDSGLFGIWYGSGPDDLQLVTQGNRPAANGNAFGADGEVFFTLDDAIDSVLLAFDPVTGAVETVFDFFTESSLGGLLNYHPLSVTDDGTVIFFAKLFGDDDPLPPPPVDGFFALETDGNLTALIREREVIDGKVVERLQPGTSGSFGINDRTLVLVDEASGGDRILRIVLGDGTPTDFVWSGACPDQNTNWHGDCQDSNWLNSESGPPATFPPGSALDGSEIAKIANANVIISEKGVVLGSLDATGFLTVDQPLSLNGASTIHNLTLGSALDVAGSLILLGNSSIQAGAIIQTDDGGSVTNQGTFTIEEGMVQPIINIAAVAPANDVVPPQIAGSYKNEGTTEQKTNVELDGAKVENQSGANWNISAGSVERTDVGGPSSFVNRGRLTKLAASAPKVTVAAPFESEGGTIAVESGTLSFTGNGIHEGGTYSVLEDATLEFDNVVTALSDELTASGGGNVILKGGSYFVGIGATAIFDLEGAQGLDIVDATVSANGRLTNDGKTTFRSGTLRGGEIVGGEVQGGFVNAPGATFEVAQILSDDIFSDDTSFHGFEGIFQNQGTIKLTRESRLTFLGGTLFNPTGGNILLSRLGTIEQKPETENAIENAGGTLRTEDFGIVDVPLNVSNGGIVKVDTGGELVIKAGGNHSGTGRFDLEGQLRISGEHVFDGEFDFSGTGGLALGGIRGGSLVINGGSVTNTSDAGVFLDIHAVGGAFINEGRIVAMGGPAVGGGIWEIRGGMVTDDGSENGFLNRGGNVVISGNVLVTGVLRNTGSGIAGVVNQRAAVVVDGNILNDEGGEWRLTGSGGVMGLGTGIVGNGSFQNRGGTLVRDGTGKANIRAPFNLSSGQVVGLEGHLGFLGGSNNVGAGSFLVAKDSKVEFGNSGPHTFDGNYTASGEGMLEFSENSSLVVKDGFSTHFTGPGEVVFSGLQAGGSFGGVLTNKGQADWKSGALHGFVNDEGAALTISFGGVGSHEKKIQDLFQNDGTIIHAKGVAVLVAAGTTLTNSGDYELHGDLLAPDAEHTFFNDIDGTFIVKEPNVSRAFHGSFDNKGTVEVVAGSHLTLSGPVTQLSEGTETVLKGGKWISLPGSTIGLGSGVPLIDQNDGVIIMHGSGRLSNMPTNGNSSNVAFENNGAFELRDTNIFVTSGSFETNGNLVVDATSKLIVSNPLGGLSGGFEMNSGLFLLDGELVTKVIDLDGGTIKGTGHITAETVTTGAAVFIQDLQDVEEFNNNGILNIGSSPGLLEFTGDYNQSGDGLLNIELGGTTAGTEFDQLIVGGTATFEIGEGVLVDLIDPANDNGANVFTPSFGDIFDIVMADDIVLSGTGDVFELLTLPSLPQGLFFEASILDWESEVDVLRLSVNGELVTSAPEPSTLALMALGLAGVGFSWRIRS